VFSKLETHLKRKRNPCEGFSQKLQIKLVQNVDSPSSHQYDHPDGVAMDSWKKQRQRITGTKSDSFSRDYDLSILVAKK